MAMPVFVAMITRWQELQQELPHYYEVIQVGIKKLEQYHTQLAFVPAYMLSICKSCVTFLSSQAVSSMTILLQ